MLVSLMRRTVLRTADGGKRPAGPLLGLALDAARLAARGELSARRSSYHSLRAPSALTMDTAAKTRSGAPSA